MATQTFYSTHDLNNRDYAGITFGDSPNMGNPTKTVEAIWETTIPPRPEAVDATHRLEALGELFKKYPEAPDFKRMILDDPIDSWEETLEDYAKTAAIRSLMERHWADTQNSLRKHMSERRSPGEQYGHVLTHLDISTVADKFTTVAQELGEDAYSTEAAINANPTALTTFRETGQKLKALTKLGQGLEMPTHHRGIKTAALFTGIDPLPRLTGYWIKDTMNPTHEEKDQQIHDTIEQAMHLAENNIDGYLTLLAQGKYPHLTLDIATTEDEIRARVLTLEEVGTVETVPNPNRKPSIRFL